MKNKSILIWVISMVIPYCVKAQNEYSTVQYAAPFLNISPSTRSASMGDVGVATSSDISSAYWNPAKIIFNKKYSGVEASYTPWLSSVADGISLSSIGGYISFDQSQAVGASFRYFSLGDNIFRDDQGNETQSFRPNEFAVDISYSKKLGENTSLGLTTKYIRSSLSGGQNVNGLTTSPANAFALDVAYFQKISTGSNNDFSYGISLTNIGSKIKYLNGGGKRSFLPMAIRIGTAYKIEMNTENTFEIGLDFSKPLSPSAPNYDSNGNIIKGKDPDRSIANALITSFSDAPGGFKQEILEVQSSLGAEYMFKEIFFFRGGISIENKLKGNRNYGSLGFGFIKKFNENMVNFDLGYMIPLTANSPLKNTFRLSVGISIPD